MKPTQTVDMLSPMGWGLWHLFLLFLGLKLSDHIDWSWPLVFSPFLFVGIIGLIMLVFKRLTDRANNAIMNHEGVKAMQDAFSQSVEIGRRRYNEEEAEKLRKMSEDLESIPIPKKPASAVERLNKANARPK